MRCIYQTFPNRYTGAYAKVYQIRKGEYLNRVYVIKATPWAGMGLVALVPDCDYETNDRDDAISTAHAQVGDTVPALIKGH